MSRITVEELAEMLNSIDDKTQEVKVWDKSIAQIKEIEYIYENVCNNLDIVIS